MLPKGMGTANGPGFRGHPRYPTAWRLLVRDPAAQITGGQTMKFPQSGGCQCGAIRYEITGPPAAVYACHCTECQRQSGSAFAMAAVIPQAHFRIVAGQPKMFARQTSR